MSQVISGVVDICELSGKRCERRHHVSSRMDISSTYGIKRGRYKVNEIVSTLHWFTRGRWTSDADTRPCINHLLMTSRTPNDQSPKYNPAIKHLLNGSLFMTASRANPFFWILGSQKTTCPTTKNKPQAVRGRHPVDNNAIPSVIGSFLRK